jgi:hypothetical protein
MSCAPRYVWTGFANAYINDINDKNENENQRTKGGHSVIRLAQYIPSYDFCLSKHF